MVTVIDRHISGPGPSGRPIFGAHRGSISGFLRAVFGNTPAAFVALPTLAPQVPVPEKILRRVAGTAGKWKKQQAAAALHWPRISADELLWSDGHVVRLVGLVQQHYQISQPNAERQVARFFDLNIR